MRVSRPVEGSATVAQLFASGDPLAAMDVALAARDSESADDATLLVLRRLDPSH